MAASEQNTSAVIDYFFHSPHKHAKKQLPDLSAGERDAYGRLAATTQPNQLFVFWNSETSSHVGKHNYQHTAKGYAIGLSKKLPLEQLMVDQRFLLPSRWFAHIAVMRVPNEALPEGTSEDDMKKAIKSVANTINGSSAGFRERRAALAAAFTQPLTVNDPAEWQAGVAAHGQFAGLYKKHDKTIGAPPEYFLAVHADSEPVLGDALTAYAVAHPTMPLGEFVSSAPFATVRRYSQRNVHRILAELADALNLSRKHVARTSDLLSAEPANYRALPELVRSDQVLTDTMYNSFYDPFGTSDTHTLIYYNGVTRLSENTRQVAVLKNAKQGLALIQLDPRHNYTSFQHKIVSTGDTSHLLSHENPHAALPVGLGRLHGGNSRDLVLQSKLTLEAARELHGTYVWPGRTEVSRLSTLEDVVTALDPRLYSYRPFESQNKNLIQWIVGETSRTTDLRPVQVILPATQQ